MRKIYPLILIALLFAVQSEKKEYLLSGFNSYSDYADYYHSSVAQLKLRHNPRLVSKLPDILPSTDLKELLNSTIIIDTTSAASYKSGGEYFIKAAGFNKDKFLCDLKCSEDIYNSIRNSGSGHFLLALKVTSVKSERNIVELDSIDNKSLFVDNGNNILLRGECLEALELPFPYIKSDN